MKRAKFIEMWRRDDGNALLDCWYCGVDIGFGSDAKEQGFRSGQIEHQTPVSRGGGDHPSNLVPSCRSCNIDKGTRTLEEYRDVVFQRRVDGLARAIKAIRALEQDGGHPVWKIIDGKRLFLSSWLQELQLFKAKQGPSSVRFHGEYRAVHRDPFVNAEQEFYAQDFGPDWPKMVEGCVVSDGVDRWDPDEDGAEVAPKGVTIQ